ncbi:MAG: helix-turn-helix domain-containing protein [Terriglobia bacterium]
MHEDRFTFSEVDLAEAIRGLREALGRSPEVMAQLVGCRLPAYEKWEAGILVPEAEWLIRMLRLCPDEETRNAFRIRAERRGAARQKRVSLAARHLSAGERDRCRQAALAAIRTIAECGDAGIHAADSRLVQFTADLRSAAESYLSELEQATNLDAS